jgi:signal transduction histidine kinase
LRDLTERKKAEETLHQAQAQLADRADRLEQSVAERTAELTASNQQLEAFVYSIAHDLRAPLRAMQAFSTMLVEEAGARLSEQGLDFANRINTSAQFMDGLLTNLLAFSQLSQQRLELTSVHLERTVEAVVSRLQKDLQETNARLESSGPWPFVLAHEPTLAQVLFNLVGNALKFVRPDVAPVVRLRAEEQETSVRVWVEDNGIGVAPDHQEQIFRLFLRLHGTKYPGTGIGLAIVQKSVERMGGRVGVESNLGQGSRFWFELRKAEIGDTDQSIDSINL